LVGARLHRVSERHELVVAQRLARRAPADRLDGRLIERLKRAAAHVLSRPVLYWLIAAVFGLRLLVFTVIAPRRFDAEGMWEGSHAYLTNPSHMYDQAADYLTRLHIIAPPGGLNAFVSPPPSALLAAPFSSPPRGMGG